VKAFTQKDSSNICLMLSVRIFVMPSLIIQPLTLLAPAIPL